MLLVLMDAFSRGMALHHLSPMSVCSNAPCFCRLFLEAGVCCIALVMM